MKQDEMIEKFRRVKRDPTVVHHQIALEHLTELNERLEALINGSDERLRYLEFEEIHWKVQNYFVQLERFLHGQLNEKLGDRKEIEDILRELQVKSKLVFIFIRLDR